MRKEKSRDAARSRRSKENHEFYELAKLLPLPAAITSQLDFLDKASIIRLTISFLKLRQFSVNGSPAWAPDFTTLGSINPYSSQSLSSYAADQYRSGSSTEQDTSRPASTCHKGGDSESSTLPSAAAYSSSPYHAQYLQQQQTDLPPTKVSTHTNNLFDLHQGTHILQSLDGFAFAIGRDGKFLYISETVSMYLGLSQVEMTGSSVFDYTHQQDHEELARQLGINYSASAGATLTCNQDLLNPVESPHQPASVRSQYSAASNETLIDEYMNSTQSPAAAPTANKRQKTTAAARGAYGPRGAPASGKRKAAQIKMEQSPSVINNLNEAAMSDPLRVQGDDSESCALPVNDRVAGTSEDPLVRQFCIRMKSTLTKRGCQHFKSSGYRVVHVVAHLRSYQSNDHGHLMDPLDDPASSTNSTGTTTPSTTAAKPAGKRKKPEPKTNYKPAASSSSTSSSSVATTTTTSVARERGSPHDNICDNNLDQQQTVARPQKIIGLVAVAIALPPPSINELRLESDTFVLRLGLDLRITHIEPKITELLHYPIEHVAGRSLYSFIHPADVQQVQKCHRDLLKKGQMMSGYYRLLARSGGYIWIQTCATLICNNTLGAHSNSTLASSPSLSTITTASGGQQSDYSKLLPLPGSSSSAVATYHQPVSESAQPFKQRIASPASHLSSSTNYGSDQAGVFDQDQCVIFVNYMITNVIETDQILDICQSANYAPPLPAPGGPATFSGPTLFSSPSSCSSPSICNNGIKAAPISGTGYPSPPTRPTSRRQASDATNNHQPGKRDTVKLMNGNMARRVTYNNQQHHHQQQQQQHLPGKALQMTEAQDTQMKSKLFATHLPTGDLSTNSHSISGYSASSSSYSMNYYQPQYHQHQHDNLAPLYAQSTMAGSLVNPLQAQTGAGEHNNALSRNTWLAQANGSANNSQQHYMGAYGQTMQQVGGGGGGVQPAAATATAAAAAAASAVFHHPHGASASTQNNAIYQYYQYYM